MNRTPVRRSRRIATVVVTIAACIGMLASSLGLWVNHAVFDSQRFSRTSAEAITDPVVASALADYLTDQILELTSNRIDLEGHTPAVLRPYLSSLRIGLQDTISEQVTQLLSSDRAEEVLRVALERSHRTLMRVLDGNGDVVRLNLLPILSSSIIAVQRRGLIPESLRIPVFAQAGDPGQQIGELERITGHELSPTFGQLTIYRGDAVSKAGPTVEVARYAVMIFRRALWGIVGVTVLLMIGAIALSSRRRRTAIHLALGLAASTLVTGLFLDHVRSRLPLLVEPERREAAKRIASYFVSNLVNLTHLLAGVGIVMALVFLVTDPSWLGRFRSDARDVAPVASRHHRGIATTVGFVALGVLALAGISWTSVTAAAVIIVGYLVVARRFRRSTPIPSTAGRQDLGS